MVCTCKVCLFFCLFVFDFCLFVCFCLCFWIFFFLGGGEGCTHCCCQLRAICQLRVAVCRSVRKGHCASLVLFDSYELTFRFMSSSVITCPSYKANLLAGLVVKASASRAEDPGFESRLRRDFFRIESIKLALQWLPCQAPCVIGSALGLVGPMSVYCYRVR